MTLDDALAAADWPRALGLALDAWRGSRSPALADLIDVLTARIPRTTRGPRLALHRHWMRAALAYDALGVGPLLDVVHDRLMKADAETADALQRLGDDPILAQITRDGTLPDHQRNRIERLCAIARWPDDPRAATVLARWFARDGFTADPPHEETPRVMLEAMAQLLVRIGDPRVVPVVAGCVTRPRARTEALRAIQQELAREIVGAIAPRADEAKILAWNASLAPAAVTSDDALWDAVAAEPDALAPRMVLADQLLARGDARGELIALQCAGEEVDPHVVRHLIARHWDAWLGDLALVAVRGESRFERGMLASVALGLHGTPAWVYTATALHRELATVRVWRTTQHANMHEAARMLALRPRLDELELQMRDVSTFGAARAAWDVRKLDLGGLARHHGNPGDDAAPQLLQTLRMFPTLEALHLRPPFPTDIAAALPLLARWKTLRRITLRLSAYDDAIAPGLHALAATFPLLEILA